MPTVTDDTECIHGLVGCANCQGIDEGTQSEAAAAGIVQSWTSEDLRVASDASLTSHECADLLGRSTNQVSAKRTGGLDMKGYAGWVSRGR